MTDVEKADADAEEKTEADEPEAEEKPDDQPEAAAKPEAEERPEAEATTAEEKPAEERSWGFPAFARGFPRDPELDALVAKFADGDYLAVRTGAPRLAAKDGVSADVKKAAELLRARVEPDTTARTFFGLAAALLVFLTVWWVTHDGPEHRGSVPAPPPPQVEIVK
ncbi:MAG TPA: hypothetical protein VLT33_39575 [Labilithrix sp.]|nr:hypothetical protein [Labilithrix sp.]